MSARNSPVNALLCSGESVVRGFPESQVKSANANGGGLGGSSGGAVACAAATPGHSARRIETTMRIASSVDAKRIRNSLHYRRVGADENFAGNCLTMPSLSVSDIIRM